jgi:hypothetical protein
LAAIDIAGISNLALANEQPNNGFTIDSDVLRSNPDVVVRKHFYQSINKLNSTADYNNYGIIVQVVNTTEPQLPVNRLKKGIDPALFTTFTEYIVMPVDKSHASIQTYLSTAEDILKSTTLIRCSSDLIGEELAEGTLVKIQYDNTTKENATIVQKYADKSTPNTDNGAAATGNAAAAAFNGPGCTPDTSVCYSSSDPVSQSGGATSVNQSSQPTPQFALPPCPKIEVPANVAAAIASTKSSKDPNGFISKYFKLIDLQTTNSIPSADNKPNDQEIERLIFLANSLLDPLVDMYGQGSFHLNSAFRNDIVNRAVGGVPDNQHRAGTATDISFHKIGRTMSDLCNRAEEIMNNKSLQIDQFIIESSGPGSGWFHISVPHPTTRWKVARTSLSLPGGRLMYGPYTFNGVEKKYIPYNRNSIVQYATVNNFRMGMLA